MDPRGLQPQVRSLSSKGVSAMWKLVRLVSATNLSLVLLAALCIPVQGKKSFCPEGFANFGDSLTDTGNALDVFPYIADAEFPPYGEQFFGAPAKRFSNGRIVNDFISLAFRVPLLDAYFATTVLDYSHGINFAVGGATAALNPKALVPFPIAIQVAQFVRFKRSSEAVRSERACSNALTGLPPNGKFSNWLYTITIGGNDVLLGLQYNVSIPDIISTVIPTAVVNISAAVQALYTQNARKFLIFNLPPAGCSTIIQTSLEALGLPKDSLGCVASVNQLNQLFNAELFQAVQTLRASLPDATISYFDYYSANIEILQNASYYGFDPSKIFTACCGGPGVGTFNYNPNITCGHPELGSNNCANPEEYINWDGVHFTEHFYRLIAKFALEGKFTDDPVNYAESCKLDFSKFGPNVTYSQVYPNRCENLFN